MWRVPISVGLWILRGPIRIGLAVGAQNNWAIGPWLLDIGPNRSWALLFKSPKELGLVNGSKPKPILFLFLFFSFIRHTQTINLYTQPWLTMLTGHWNSLTRGHAC